MTCAPSRRIRSTLAGFAFSWTNTVTGTIGEYFYDGDGKRVKKYVPKPDPEPDEVTIFVYDASGKLIEEYSTIVATTNDAKIAYLTNDHLGSPRINTDANSNVTSRHDYHPFGEEIATSQRTSGLVYSDDTIRKRFTGHERDGESELDFAQARYYGSLWGRFQSPDSFTKDAFRESPQSWNLYVYARNSPLSLVDPTGEKVKLTSKHDKKTNTTTITITGSIAMYAAEGQDISQEDLDRQANLLRQAIGETYGNGTFNYNGTNFVVNAKIDVKVFGSESEAISSKADNLIKVGSDALVDNEGQNRGEAFSREGESFDRVNWSINQGIPGGFVEADESYQRSWAHEFAHLVGAPDGTSGLLESAGMSNIMTNSNWVDLFTNERSHDFGSSPPPPAGPRGFGASRGTAGVFYQSRSNILSAAGTLEDRRTDGQEVSRWVRRSKR